VGWIWRRGPNIGAVAVASQLFLHPGGVPKDVRVVCRCFVPRKRQLRTVRRFPATWLGFAFAGFHTANPSFRCRACVAATCLCVPPCSSTRKLAGRKKKRKRDRRSSIEDPDAVAGPLALPLPQFQVRTWMGLLAVAGLALGWAGLA